MRGEPPKTLLTDKPDEWCVVPLSDVRSMTVYDVSVHDPFFFTAVPVSRALVALVAVLVPAVRAGRVDPVLALTKE